MHCYTTFEETNPQCSKKHSTFGFTSKSVLIPTQRGGAEYHEC